MALEVLADNPHPDNIYSSLIQGQKFAVIPSLELESGDVLHSCPVAYKTWGRLNENADNVLVICHALTGSSDVGDWWAPLLGPGKAFDPRHFFIFCGNVLGSPYGSASPLTADPLTGKRYGPSFPQTTVRDDVHAHRKVLDALGVRSVAAVIGGSMGGMTALEWPLCNDQGYVRGIIPIATAADHSAWGISWAETQRQCIYADPVFDSGHYDPSPEGQPSAGLSAARMIAMLTYRSCVSFDHRFGRRPPRQTQISNTSLDISKTWGGPPMDLPRTNDAVVSSNKPVDKCGIRMTSQHVRSLSHTFSAQGYLHYQGEKFIGRFDANCYLHLTHKMDSHDVIRGRGLENLELNRPAIDGYESDEETLRKILSKVPPGALVISVETDALFLPEQQRRLAACLPNASISILKSSDGHDGFLLEFEQLDALIQAKLRVDISQFYQQVHMYEIVMTEIPGGQGEGSLTGEVEQW
ncbi:homoserine O-acetyltransferase [Grosmannia clavigera kw1407]|uniref:Homoserine O-acetyltransferase n=1 Tax=Grosmannia clavigera (strain kw1407 / UAMH 11150) TaxID=655863 RepID=F0X9W1_GROCL|nr:homoserine O-acetyltransferase [Grosmannia clavigera kw1407]EFX05905.1 homoserine O-acetyltransferase [Grosmannia clavigera kw1407]